jgi:uncharacterized lipoprotein
MLKSSYKDTILITRILVSIVIMSIMSGCSMFSGDEYASDFDTDSFNYAKAKSSPPAQVPGYIAKNIKKQPLYVIPENKKLNGDLNLSKVPPTLAGKIEEYG